MQVFVDILHALQLPGIPSQFTIAASGHGFALIDVSMCVYLVKIWIHLYKAFVLSHNPFSRKYLSLIVHEKFCIFDENMSSMSTCQGNPFCKRTKQQSLNINSYVLDSNTGKGLKDLKCKVFLNISTHVVINGRWRNLELKHTFYNGIHYKNLTLHSVI